MSEQRKLDQDREDGRIVRGHIFIYFYYIVENKGECHAPIHALLGDYASG